MALTATITPPPPFTARASRSLALFRSAAPAPTTAASLTVGAADAITASRVSVADAPGSRRPAVHTSVPALNCPCDTVTVEAPSAAAAA